MSDYIAEYNIPSTDSEENEYENFQEKLKNLSFNKFLEIFDENQYNFQNEENKLEESDRYFIKNLHNTCTNNSTDDKNSLSAKNKFVTSFVDKNKVINKKRGRQIKETNSSNNKNKPKVHDKFSTDNLLRKIQVHYISFIIAAINSILKNLGYKEEFLKLDYETKKNVSRNYFEILKKSTLSDIICNHISKKYKEKEININQTIYVNIQQNEVLRNLLNENYLIFFRTFYYKSQRNINLEKYGLNIEINLNKDVKMFKDLIKDIKDDDVNNKKYIEEITFCVIQNYLPENKFLIY